MACRAVVVAVLLWCGVAQAEPADVLPRGLHVAKNSKLWVLGDIEVGYLIRDGHGEQIEGQWDPALRVTTFTPALVPGRYEFEVGHHGTAFTVVDEIDRVAPAPIGVRGTPQILTRAPVNHDGSRRVKLLALPYLAPSLDGPLVRITFTQAGRSPQTRIFLPPGDSCAEDLGIDLSVGEATISLEGLDTAGNVGAPTTIPVHVAVGDNVCVPYEVKGNCGLGDTVLLLFGGFVAVAFLLGTAVVGMIRRVGRGIADELPAPCSLLAAEQLVRRARLWDSAWMLAGLGFLAALYSAWPYATVLGAPWALMWILDYVLSARRMRIVETSGAVAELYGYNLVVRAGDRSSRLRLSKRGLARAHSAAVPTVSTI